MQYVPLKDYLSAVADLEIYKRGARDHLQTLEPLFDLFHVSKKNRRGSTIAEGVGGFKSHPPHR